MKFHGVFVHKINLGDIVFGGFGVIFFAIVSVEKYKKAVLCSLTNVDKYFVWQ